MSSAPLRFNGARVRLSGLGSHGVAGRRGARARPVDRAARAQGRRSTARRRCSPSSSHGSSRSVASTRACRGSTWADWARRLPPNDPGVDRGASTMARSRARRLRRGRTSGRGSASDRRRRAGPDHVAQVAAAHLATMLDAACRSPRLVRHGVLYGSLASCRSASTSTCSSCSAWPRASFPPTGVDSSVLSYAERAVIGSPFAPRAARASDERRSYLAAVASARQAVARHAEGRRRSSRPSRRRGWPDAPCQRRGHDRLVRRGAREPTRASRIVAGARPPGAATGPAPASLATIPLDRVRDRGSRVGFAAVAARLGDEFTEWDGDVGAHPQLDVGDTLAVGDLAADVGRLPALGTSSATCSRVREQDDVAEVDELEARHRGTLVHKILEGSARVHLARTREPQSQLGLSRRTSPVDGHGARGRRSESPMMSSTSSSGFGGAPYDILWTVEKQADLARRACARSTQIPTDAILLAVEHHFGDVDEREPPFSLDAARAGGRCTSRGRSTASIGCTTGFG